MNAVYNTLTQVRDLINKPRKQTSLLANKKLWNQLCSSLDVIADTLVIFKFYRDKDVSTKIGEKYLRIYGVLQAIFVQQDALRHLLDSLNLSSAIPLDDPELKKIRNIRNESIGHPTKQGGGKSYHVIRQSENMDDQFLLASYFSDGRSEFKEIDVNNLIEKQLEFTNTALVKIKELLIQERGEHKMQYKNEKMSDIIGKSLNYNFEKMWETIHSFSKYSLPIRRMPLDELNVKLEQFKQALENRGLWDAYDSIRDIYKEIQYPLEELEKYFLEQLTDTRENHERSRIYLENIQNKVNYLKKLASEIDEEYEET